MKTTITFRNIHGMVGDLVDAHDGHEVTLHDDQRSNPPHAADGDRTYRVICLDCTDYYVFPAWGEELEITTDRMPCRDFTYVGSDAYEMMGDPDELDVIGYCGEWQAPSWDEVNLHREVLRRFRNAKA